MTDRLTLTLWNPQQGYQCLLQARDYAKAMLMAGHRLVLEIRPQAKTRPQEKKYHAMIKDISRQVDMNGRKWTEEDAKRILVSAFKEDTKADPVFAPLWAQFGAWSLVPGLRGEYVVVGIQTRKFGKELASGFIEWLYAFGAEFEVQWTEPREHIDAETGEILETA